ncbi:MAG: phosphoglucosamine mutase [Sulfolobales archaeon]|nr:phosphoglucosamine mutase [Sulfolobales archaeon]MDW8083120.1 phosphoglucosamine mutase [Sulfolobales archaeon]
MSSRRLFGTDGVRGVVNVDLTPEMVLRLSLSIGTYFGLGSRVVVGSDMRAGNSFLTYIVIGGLISTGVKVYNAGLVPTPALQYYVKTRGFDGGVMITASHNPPEYSGVKIVMADGVEAPRKVEEEIEEIYHELKFRRVSWREISGGVVRVYDVVDHYLDGIVDLIDVDRVRKLNLKVAIDPANNVGALATPRLLRTLGVNLVAINSDLSYSPSRPPEPIPENLEDLIAVVKSTRANFGIAHDGDADRAIFIDDRGLYVPGDVSAVLLCRHLVENRSERDPPRVVTAVSSSTLISKILSTYGIEVVWTRVGSINISRTMVERGALAGFEENGGFMYPKHQYVRDGAMTTALMVEMLSYEKTSLSNLLSELPKRHVVKKRVYTSRERLPKVYEIIRERFSNIEFVDIDGLKGISDKFWFLVRPSGTEPLVRVFVEAETEQLLSEILKELVDIFVEVYGSEVRIA